MFVNSCSHPAQARHLIDRAIRCALTDRGVATIIFPEDVQEEEAVPSPPPVYSSIGWSRPRILPFDADLDRAASVLNEGERVAMLIGQSRPATAARSPRASPTRHP